jgi:hypothetical protein
LREFDAAIRQRMCSGDIAIRNRFRQLHVADHDEERQIRDRRQGHQLLALIRGYLDILAVIQLVAIELEHASKVRELGINRVAGETRHAGLTRK